MHRSLKVCLISQRLPVPVIERMAREIIASSGADSEERFNRVVLGEGVTFREQALYPRVWNASVMDLPLVVYSKQKRPALKTEGINALIDAAESDEESICTCCSQPPE